MSKLRADTLRSLKYVENLGRRDFLRIAAAAASLVACGGLLKPAAALAALPQGIAHMNEGEYAVFRRLMEVVLPTDGTSLLPTDKIPVLQTLDGALLATMEAHILKGLKGGVAYFNDGPMAAFGKRFVDLGEADAIRFCDAWANSTEVPQRALAMGLKKLMGLAYWANPPTWAPLGYDGPVTKRWGLKSLGNAPIPMH
jgi:hypothetical protein